MDIQRLWVTGYQTPDGEVLVARRPGTAAPIIFMLDEDGYVQRLTHVELDEARHDLHVRFYSIPDPF